MEDVLAIHKLQDDIIIVTQKPIENRSDLIDLLVDDYDIDYSNNIAIFSNSFLKNSEEESIQHANFIIEHGIKINEK